MRMIDLTGQRFGRLSVMHRAGTKHGQARWRCLCDCEGMKDVPGYDLRRGATRSCGCLQRESMVESGRRMGRVQGRKNRRHGKSQSPIYAIWRAMKQRCEDPNSHAYQWYGGRGILVCEPWQTFENFLADMGERPEGKTLDRIDNDGNYEPANCRWATPKEQANNRRPVI